MNWLGVTLVLAGLVLAIGVLSRIGRTWPPELTRKTVHLLMGMVCLSFPWVFTQPGEVWLIAALAVLGLRVMQRVKMTGALHAVERRSAGEVWFPMGVAVVFHLTHLQPLFYVIPILLLTFADTAGALIGQRYGLTAYQTDEGTKSAEGSLAFFLTSFLVVHVGLLLFSDLGRLESLLIAGVLALLLMLAEAVAWRGLDNLLIPVAAYVLLVELQNASALELWGRLAVVVSLALLGLVWGPRTTLITSAVLAGALFSFFFWLVGGWRLLMAPVLLFFVYGPAGRLVGVTLEKRDTQAVIRVFAGPLVLLSLWALSNGEKPLWFYAIWTCFAAHLMNVCMSHRAATLQSQARRLPIGPPLLVGMTAGIGCFLLPGWLLAEDLSWQLLLVATGAMVLSGLIFMYPRLWPERLWLREAILAPAVVLILFSPWWL